MKHLHWIFVVGLISIMSVEAGNFQPLSKPNKIKPLVKSEVKGIDEEVWFPTNILVVVSNKVFYYVPSVWTYNPRRPPLDKDEIIPSGFIGIYKDYRKHVYRVNSVSTNFIQLGIQGTLNQRKVPVTVLSDLTPKTAHADGNE
jgi:hypothetical protein